MRTTRFTLAIAVLLLPLAALASTGALSPSAATAEPAHGHSQASCPPRATADWGPDRPSAPDPIRPGAVLQAGSGSAAARRQCPG
jgi:hypothetical protein